MARALVVVQSISRFGLTTQVTGTTGDVANGLYLPNDGATFLRFTSTAPGTQTVTALIPGGVDVDLTVNGRPYSVPAGSVGSYTGFFPVNIYGTELLLDTSSALLKVAAYSFLA